EVEPTNPGIRRIRLVHEEPRLGVDPQEDELDAENGHRAPDEHEVEVHVEAPDAQRSREEQRLQSEPDDGQHEARYEEESRRAHEEQITRDSPTVHHPTPGDTRLPGVKGDRHFYGFEPLLGRFDEHLAREFHPGCAQVQPLERLATDAPEPATHVRNPELEEPTGKRRLHRLEEVAVSLAHSIRANRAVPTGPDH